MGKPLSHFQRGTTLLPHWLKMHLAKLMLKLAVGNYKDYGFPKPMMKIDERHPTINTDTLINIKNGKIKVKGGVRRLMGEHVEFEDGSTEEIDTIVYATGFTVEFPFLPPALNRVKRKNIVKVYGFGMYDDYKGIYIVGWFQPRGGVGSLISPYADLLADLVKAQDKFESPVGAVLKEMGEKLPETHLFGGPEFLQWVKKKRKQISKIVKMGLKLDNKNPGFRNEVLEKDKNIEPAQII